MSEGTNLDGLKAWTHVIYGLHAFTVVTGIVTPLFVVTAFLTGWPSIIAVILNYVKRSEATGTFLESHFRWQIRTFWFTLLWFAVCAVLWITVIGIPFSIALLVAIGVWVVYRMIRGWVALSGEKALPV